MSRKILVSTAAEFAVVVATLATPAAAQEVADKIWHGGPVLTMEDGAMRAEAIAVEYT